MPDLDILDHSAAHGWHKPYRLLVGDASPPEVARAALQSLSRSLRRGGGLPVLDTLREIVDRVAAGELTAPEALRQVRVAELAAGGQRHTRVAARAAAELVVALSQGETLGGDAGQAVAEGFCWALLDHQLFGRARPEMLGQRFADHAAAIAWEGECKEAVRPGVSKLAAVLAETPRARNIRAPRMPNRTRRSTAEFLHAPLTP